MIIQSSAIAMGSTRTYKAIEAGNASYSGWGRLRNANTGSLSTAAALPQAKDSMQRTATKKETGSTRQSLYSLERENTLKGSRQVKSARRSGSYFGSNKLEFGAFSSLMELLFHSFSSYESSHSQYFSSTFEGQSWSFQGLTGQWNGIAPTQSWGGEVQASYYHEEQEETSFYSSGTVKTADGKSIDFDISAIMSRSFSEYAKVEIDYGAAYMVDPLVMNLDTGSAEVREQKFLFDIDADGEMDNISMLSEACGFLALDKNGDGKVNDGSELFGTATGNGFEELAVFDMDGNGWIDEKDEIFNKLRIWTKDAQGKDKLVGLGVAGIGAIYLGNVATKFNLNAPDTNQTNAQVKNTGIYLKESGEAGTIQHVDMAAG